MHRPRQDSQKIDNYRSINTRGTYESGGITISTDEFVPKKDALRSLNAGKKRRQPLGLMKITDVLGASGQSEFASSFVLWLDNLLEDNNYSHDELKKRTVLEEATKQNLVDEFRATLSKLNLPAAEADAFIDSVADEVRTTNLVPVIALPTDAPELYKKRTDKKEKPDTFIRRVYAQWLGKGLLRPHIKDLDLSLYRAIYKHGIPDDFETFLPKAAGRKISAPKQSDLNVLERKRARDRIASQRYYAKSKEKFSI